MCSASLPPPLLPSPLFPSTIPYLTYKIYTPDRVFVASVCARASYLSLTTTTLLQIAPPRSPFPSPPFPSFFRVATSYVRLLPSRSFSLSPFSFLLLQLSRRVTFSPSFVLCASHRPKHVGVTPLGYLAAALLPSLLNHSVSPSLLTRVPFLLLSLYPVLYVLFRSLPPFPQQPYLEERFQPWSEGFSR